MKSLIDYFMTSIIFVLVLTSLLSFSMVELQILAARNLHNNAIDLIQSSNHTISIDLINNSIKQYFPSWSIESETISNINNHKTELITLSYTIVNPIIQSKQNEKISGYAY